MRQRMTWSRKASAHPAYPDEGAASPAYPGADPGEHDYENGNTSSWAEDPTKGPYKQSAHPAYPDEGPASPAYKQAALERKAAKCIRIASAMLGKRASTRAIEDQALVFMDLDNRAIQASLARLAGEDVEEDEDEGEHEAQAKKANLRRNRRMASGCEECGEYMDDEFADEDEMFDEAARKNTPKNYAKPDCGSSASSQEWGMKDSTSPTYHKNYDECYNAVTRRASADEESMLDELMLESMLEEEAMGKYARVNRRAGEDEAEDEEPKAEKKARMQARLARLRRLAADEDEAEDEEPKAEKKARMQARLARLRRLAADEGEAEEPKAEEPKAEKKASAQERLARLRRLVAKAEAEAEAEAEEPKAEKTEKKAAWGSEEEALLEQLMEEEGVSEEGMMPPLEAEEAESFDEDSVLEDMLAEEEAPLFEEPALDDPMGVVDLSADERLLMAKLFGKKAGEESETEAKEEAKEEAEAKVEKKASFRPQPRKTPNGVTRLGGGVTKEASVANDLSKLWDSAPDVSKYF